MMHPSIVTRWRGEACIVAATGPSLTADVVARCREAYDHCTHRVIAVSDAHRLMPWADVLYSCDAAWWDHHQPAAFAGELWSSHDDVNNNKQACAERHGLNLIAGSTDEGFSLDPKRIHYGSNSGFQAVNLALLFGANPIILVGFNMRAVGDQKHFFGEHPQGLRRTPKYETFVPAFNVAAKHLPPDIDIINATPESALTCFMSLPLEAALDYEERLVAWA